MKKEEASVVDLSNSTRVASTLEEYRVSINSDKEKDISGVQKWPIFLTTIGYRLHDFEIFRLQLRYKLHDVATL